MANGKVTDAPDKRVVAGAVPAATTIASCGCIFCDFDEKPIKMKRQYVHYFRTEGIFVCRISGIKPMNQDRKPGS